MHLNELQEWIGRTERTEDVIDPRRCAQLAGALGNAAVPAPGDPLPLPWYWIFFTPVPHAGTTGLDGHPARGTFLPPVSLPRRMWAGSRVWAEGGLRIGDKATRESRIADIFEKEGREGRLVFVSVEHDYFDGEGDRVLREEQDIVYREPARTSVARPSVYRPEVASHWSDTVQPDPVLLFRYSALTYNAHRIHYDRDWAVREEGYPGLVLQGPLTATLLLNLLHRNLPDCTVTEFSFRGVSPLYDLAPFQIHGARDGEQVLLWALTPERQLAMSMACKAATV